MPTILANGITDTIYFTYISGSGLFYRINSGSDISISFPVTIQNTNTPHTLKVYFDTNVTMDSLNSYFICGSSDIQFGSRSLKTNGYRPVINVDGVTNYPGLIQNGYSGGNGYNNIKIVNLEVQSINGTTLADGGGWIGQEYFGKAATGNTIVNCSSDGDISMYGGGIVGQASGSQSGAELVLRGCSSSGSIGQYGGGIAGHYAGENTGTVTCEKCWSTGSIGSTSGGIFGDFAGVTGGNAIAIQCYSTGTIQSNGGGIFGEKAGEGYGQATAEKCYSTGTIQSSGGGIFGLHAGYNSGIVITTNCYSAGAIQTDAGGIFGAYAGRFGGSTTAINCYTSGTITTSGTGIYGSSKINGTETNCASSNGSWSSTDANTVLSGVPSPTVGTTWVARTIDEPYELNGMGYTPYSIDIVDTSYDLIQNYTQTIQPGQNTVESVFADASGNAVAILRKAGGDTGSYASITIDIQTGVISTTTATVPGIYTLTIYSVGSYNITTFTLTIEASTTDTCCVANADLKNYDYTVRNQFINGRQLVEEQSRNLRFTSYSDYYARMMARAAKK